MTRSEIRGHLRGLGLSKDDQDWLIDWYARWGAGGDDEANQVRQLGDIVAAAKMHAVRKFKRRKMGALRGQR